MAKFSPDGTCVASAGSDAVIKIWDTRSNQLVQHYDSHTASVNSVAFHPSGNFLLSTSNDNTLKVRMVCLCGCECVLAKDGQSAW